MDFDYIVVGGGSAGCVLAARLSEDPDVRVALLEAGGKDSNVLIHVPAGLALLAKTGTANWSFDTVPQKGLNGRTGWQPRGKVLGGSSSVNAMIYIRGHRADYDHWAAEGNPGWSYADVLPYFRRAEHNERLAGEFHGKLAEMAGNPVLLRYLSELATRCSLILAVHGRPHSSDCAVNEHRELIKAIRAKDVERAQSLMGEHLLGIQDRALLAGGPPAEEDLSSILSHYARAVDSEAAG